MFYAYVKKHDKEEGKYQPGFFLLWDELKFDLF